jgi:hypothetical protein
VHVCDFTTTQISSKYVHERHTDHDENEIGLNQFEIEMYHTEGPTLKAPVAPAEGPMLKAPVALDPLMVSCSKSRTTVGAGRCTQCRPSNVHWKVDEADPRKKGHYQEGDEDVLMKKKMVSSRGDAPQKPDRPHTPKQVSLDGRWFRRPALPTFHACRELGQGSSKAARQRLVRCVYERD